MLVTIIFNLYKRLKFKKKTLMRNKLESEIIVTHSMGGMMEFDQTGIYPNTLRIKSTKLNHTWRVKVNENRQPSVLKIKKTIVYQYAFDE
jgi:hypothetical protein